MAEFVIGMVASTRRSKENWLIIFSQKLSDLPWGMDGAQRWFDTPHPKVNGRIPSQMVAEDLGHEVEVLVDELECLFHGLNELEKLRARYSEHREFDEVWAALDRAHAKAPWAQALEYAPPA